ncbi:MAG: extracellular solute-binding protein [Oscillospiraceae bacterium]|nr:extracellular solute-binding protein [Oscillospiraceae bacterium]
MKKFSRILALMLMLAMVFSVAACNGGSTTAPANGGEAGAAGGGAEYDPQADGIEAGASLIYWSMWSEAEPQAIVLAAAARAFTEATGVPVSINFNGRQGQREGLAPALAAGETIDIFDEDIDRVTGQWSDHLLNLDDLVNGVFSDTDGQPFRAKVNSGLMEMAQERGGGTFTVVPYQPFVFTTMFNKDLFEEAGITSNPTNWQEFLVACQQLVDIGIIPMTVDNSYIPALFGTTVTRIAGSERTLEIFENHEFSDPAILRTAQVFEELITNGFMSPRAATNVFPEGQAAEFAAMEAVAMYLNGTWLPNELREINPDINWGSFAWPSIDAGGAGPEAHNIGAQCFGINVNTNYPNAAFAFIRWITLGYWDQRLADDTWGVPMANDAVWPVQLQDAEVIFASTTDRLPWAAGAEDDPNVTAVIIESFQRMAAGTINAQQFADNLAAIS